jgi:CubicO group peptidase (beta-lactamase class C family)
LTPSTLVQGHVAAGFEPVRDAFAANFAEGLELGASFCVMRGEETLVDLHGGVRDAARSEPLAPDDLFEVWSTTKAMAATCLAIAVDRGLLDYRAPVASLWPEFAAAGKETITVETLVSHASGVCGPEGDTTLEAVLDVPGMAARLAAQAPLFEPGTASAYNARVFGHWVDALLRRVDGRSLADFFAEEVAGPLGADVHLALSDTDLPRRVEMVAPWAAMRPPPPKDPVLRAALANPDHSPLACNGREWMQSGFGSSGGSANARGLARVAGALANDGAVGAARILSPEGVAALRAVRREGKDKVLGMWTRWGAGVIVNNRGMYGPRDEAFGHTGLGGSFAFADPVAGVGVAYAMNLMSPSLIGEPRGRRLIEATYAALEQAAA